MIRISRTVVVMSTRIPKRLFNVLVEAEGMYRNMVEQLTMHSVREEIKSFTRLKSQKYYEMRKQYPQLPSHYAYTACQDASTRAKSFLKLKEKGLTRREYPVVRRISIWLDDHLWKPNGYTSIKIVTHKGWITIGFEPHKQYWKYINRGWKLSGEVKIKLDKKNKRIKIYLTFVKDVVEYKPRGYISVDVNENNVAVLVDGIAFIFETNMCKITLGYYYRRRRIQEKYDKKYGVESRIKKRIMRRLREKSKKNDARWKIANIIVRAAYERGYGIVLEKLGKRVANNMIKRIKDKQLRHRIYQASFRGVQNAITEKAKEYGMPIVYQPPKGTSSMCPIHRAKIIYENGSRIGRCGKGGEFWHRDVASLWNLYLKTLRGDGSNAPNPFRAYSLRWEPRAVGLNSHQ